MTILLLDKKEISSLDQIILDEASFKSSLEKFESLRNNDDKENAGPNYFLMGGPYPNYAHKGNGR
jgi:hypothetical protein